MPADASRRDIDKASAGHRACAGLARQDELVAGSSRDGPIEVELHQPGAAATSSPSRTMNGSRPPPSRCEEGSRRRGARRGGDDAEDSQPHVDAPVGSMALAEQPVNLGPARFSPLR